jgi:hypothetical protein
MYNIGTSLVVADYSCRRISLRRPAETDYTGGGVHSSKDEGGSISVRDGVLGVGVQDTGRRVPGVPLELGVALRKLVHQHKQSAHSLGRLLQNGQVRAAGAQRGERGAWATRQPEWGRVAHGSPQHAGVPKKRAGGERARAGRQPLTARRAGGKSPHPRCGRYFGCAFGRRTRPAPA